MFGAIVWVTEEFTVEDEFENATNYRVIDNYNQANNPVNLEGAIENLPGGQQDIRNHIELSGIFAVFGGFVLRERPFAGAGTVESVSKLSGKKNDEGILSRRADEG